MTTFYLVRHAHSDWSPDEDRPFSDRGSEDSKTLASRLGRYPITMIVSSPYRRAWSTVDALSQQTSIPIAIEHDLRERALGDTGGRGFLEAVETLWRDPAFAFPGGESNELAQRRGVDVLTRIRKDRCGDHVVVSTHGNLMALMLQHVDPSVDYEFWRGLTMPDVHCVDWPETGIATFHHLTEPGGSRID